MTCKQNRGVFPSSIGVCISLVLIVGCGDDESAGPGTGGTVSTGGTAGAGGTNITGGTALTGGALDTGGAIAEPTYAYDACDVTERVGGISAVLNEDHGYSSVTGNVGDVVDPVTLVNVISEAGGCRLVERRLTFCDPACSVGEVCGDGDICIPASTAHDIGTIEVLGLKDAVTIEPIAGRFNYSNKGTLTYPAFDEGGVITLNATGGEFASFSLRAEGVAPLNVAADVEIVLEENKPVELKWDAPQMLDGSRILLTLNISLHGGALARIECDQEDIGAMTIPAELITGLLGYGYSGFPAMDIARQSAASVELSVGCVDFRVRATRTRVPVTIPGLVSCSSGSGNEQCPDGQVCLQNMTCGR